MTSKKYIVLIVLGILSVLLTACGAVPGGLGVVDIPQTPTTAPDEGVIHGLAIVESNEIKILGFNPVQMVMHSRGYLPDSCTYIQETNQVREGQLITVSIITNRPSNIDCVQQIQPFELQTKLETANLDTGIYKVSVNGLVQEFEIPQQMSNTPDLNASLGGIVWHDLCAVGGGENGLPLTPSTGCVPTENNYRANGFLETGEPGLGGVAVRLGLGACPASGASMVTTAQDGSYSFTSLEPGSYCISIEPLDSQNTNILVPGEWSYPKEAISQSVASVSIGLNPGENKRGVDFGWDFQFLPAPPQVLKPTATPAPTVTPAPTPTAVIASFCDKVKFVADLTVPDYTPYTPGSVFTKSWRIQNDGTCTWTIDYELVFVNGNAMTDKLSYALPKNVRPGETVDLTVEMSAPRGSGNYKSNWMLQNPNGKSFGIGKSADQAFWALIKVVVPQNNYSYDFAANYCSATWSSGNGTLNCPGSTSSSKGFVTFFDRPTLENRNEDEPALWTRPNHSEDGWIRGRYPAISIKDGDHFRAWVGCLADSKGCDITFTLSYTTKGEKSKILGQWNEIFDGQVTKIDIDLSSLAQKSVEFTLSSEINNKKFEAANAFWFVPRIENKGSERDLSQEKAIQGAKQIVAAGTGVPAKDLKLVVVVGPLTWKDSCLEVKLDDVICIPAEIPGYQIIFKHAGKVYEAHTNIDGSIVYWFF